MDKKTSSQLSAAFWPGLLVGLIIAVSLSGTADHDLWTPDEPREAALALSMSQSGNYIIPELAGEPFVEKPPLFYIIASFFLRAFGESIGNTAALRLGSACFGLLTLLFTYLLAKIYFDRQKALMAAAILATMIGFVHLTHWLLPDNALMFFIVASIWALAKAYECGRLLYLPLAGLFTACAFLSKGLIGPLIIFIAGLGLFIPWVNKAGMLLRGIRSAHSGRLGEPSLPLLKFTSKRILEFHLVSLIIPLLISAAWIVAFAVKGGPELFREWWWTNHFGRFTGQAAHLGHISPWYYYFGVLPVYLLPWPAVFITALVVLLKKRFRAEPLPAGGTMLVMWILGAFALLSLSATKREIYLSVLLPACALLCVYGLEERPSKISRSIYYIWLFLLLGGLAAPALLPLFKQQFMGLTLTFCKYQLLAISIILVSAAAILLNAKLPFIQRFLIVLTIGYTALLATVCPLVDQVKSYGPAFRAMASFIRAQPEIRVAGCNLDETTAAGFYYYCGLVFPAVPEQQILNILQGKDSRFNGVLTLAKNTALKDLSERKNQVIFESRMGKRRLLQLRTATGKTEASDQRSEVSLKKNILH